VLANNVIELLKFKHLESSLYTMLTLLSGDSEAGKSLQSYATQLPLPHHELASHNNIYKQGPLAVIHSVNSAVSVHQETHATTRVSFTNMISFNADVDDVSPMDPGRKLPWGQTFGASTATTAKMIKAQAMFMMKPYFIIFHEDT